VSGPVALTRVTIPVVAVVAVIVATWHAPKYIMLRDAATVEHRAMDRKSREVYYEVKIDLANAQLGFMEGQGALTITQQRDYDLLKFSVKHMSEKLMETRP